MNDSFPPPIQKAPASKATRPRYTLSRSNLIYYGVVCLLLTAVFIAAPGEATATQIGEFTGQLMVYLLMSLLVGWVFWLIAQNKKQASSIAFNVVLTLALLGRFGESVDQLSTRNEVQEMRENREAFKDLARNTEDPDEYDAAYNDYQDSIRNSLKDLSDKHVGDKKRFFEISAEMVRENQVADQTWLKAYNAVLAPEIIDLSILVKGEEYDRQTEVLSNYIKASRDYHTFFKSTLTRMHKRFRELDDRGIVESAMKGARNKFNQRSPLMDSLMAEHQAYGSNLTALVSLLKSHHGAWSYEDDHVQFDADEALDVFYELAEKINQNEIKIEELSQKVIETL